MSNVQIQYWLNGGTKENPAPAKALAREEIDSGGTHFYDEHNELGSRKAQPNHGRSFSKHWQSEVQAAFQRAVESGKYDPEILANLAKGDPGLEGLLAKGEGAPESDASGNAKIPEKSAEDAPVITSAADEPIQAASEHSVLKTEEEQAAAKASEERWWRVLQAVAPRMAAQFELQVASRAEATAKFNHDVPAEAQAAIHKRVIYLFQEALEETGRAGNQRRETVRRLLHETAHAWWDTLSNADHAEFERQWKSETSEKTGPLYVDGEIRPDVMAGVESDVQEWFAERVTHANDHWAQKKAAIADHDGSLLGRVSSHLRSWLFDGMEAIRSVGSRDRLVSEFRRVMRKKSPIPDGEVRFAQPLQVSSAAEVVKAANDDGNHGVYAELPFGDSDQQEMEHALGRPIRLSHRIIDSYGVRHVQKRHGAKSRDPFPVSDSDIERINEILHAPGVAAYAGRTPQGRDTILHVRKLGDWFYTLEEVRESKETLVLFAMRKAPARTSSAQKAPSLTSETLSHEANSRLQAAIEDFKQRHGPRFAQAKPGMKLREVGDDFPIDDVVPKLANVSSSDRQGISAEMALKAMPQTVRAADGHIILIHNPESGTLRGRGRHLVTSYGDWDAKKAAWVPMIAATLQNAAVRLHDPITGNKIYVRGYRGGERHFVVTDRKGAVTSQGNFTGRLITQFSKGSAQQQSMEIDWIRPGLGQEEAEKERPGLEQTPPASKPVSPDARAATEHERG
jgi:hypothetical protein